MLCACSLLHPDRHRSFKLRLPSIRRDIRSRVKGGGSSPGGGERSPQQQPADPENPTLGEEAVPLNSLGQAGGGGGDEFDGKDEAGGSGGSDPSAGVYSRLHPAHSSIKEEEEGEGEDGGRSLGQNRAVGSGKEAIDSKRESEELLTMMRDGADVDRGEESSNRDGGGADQDPARVSVDNLSIGKMKTLPRSMVAALCLPFATCGFLLSFHPLVLVLILRYNVYCRRRKVVCASAFIPTTFPFSVPQSQRCLCCE